MEGLWVFLIIIFLLIWPEVGFLLLLSPIIIVALICEAFGKKEKK